MATVDAYDIGLCQKCIQY